MGEKVLDDATIIEAIRGFGSRAMTYVVANRLDRKWPTATIRRRLEDMERRGLVKRIPSAYAVQICWALTTPENDALLSAQVRPRSRNAA